MRAPTVDSIASGHTWSAELVVIALGRVALVVTSIATMRLITTYLSPDEVGRRYVFLSLVAFFALTLVNPIGMYINRRTHEWLGERTIFRHLNRFWLYLVAVSVVSVGLLFLVSRTVGLGVSTHPGWLLVLVGGSLLFGTANVTVTSLFNMVNARITYVLYTVGSLWLGLAFSGALACLGWATAEWWLLGAIAGQALVNAFALATLARQVGQDLQPPAQADHGASVWRTALPLLAFAWPLSLAVGLNWLQTQAYRFFLSNSVGLDALGLFATGYALSASILGVVDSVIVGYYYPLYYKEVSEADDARIALAWNAYARFLVPLAFMVGLFVVAACPWLTRLLVSQQFAAAQAFIIWGVIAELARIVGACYSMLAHARLDMKALIVPNVGAAFCALALSLGLPLVFDPLTSVGIALSVAGIFAVAALHLVFARDVAIRFPVAGVLAGAVLTLPMITASYFARTIWPQPTVLQSFLVVAFLGLLLLGGMAVGARHGAIGLRRISAPALAG